MIVHKDRFGKDILIGDFIMFAKNTNLWGPSLGFGKVKSVYEHGITILCANQVHTLSFTERSSMIIDKETGVELQLRGFI